MSSRSHKLDLTHFAPSGLPTPDAMMTALLEQQQLLADKDEALAESASRIQNQKNQIAVLQEQIKLLKMQKYASKSEQNLLQKDFFADEAETLADGQPDANDGEIDDPEDKSGEPPRRKSGKKPLSPDLPRIQRFITLSDEERAGAIETFFVKVKEELDIVPAKVQVIEVMQEKAVFVDEDGERSLKAAVRPAHPIGRSIASTHLLAWVVTGKYVDGLPLYRMEQILSRYGGEITRTTLANWVIRLSVALGPWLERLMWHLMKVDYLQCDETRLQVLREPGMSATGDKWIWVRVPQQCGILWQDAADAVREAMDMMEELWPSGVCLQGPAPNHLRAALAEDRCRERRRRSRGKPGRYGSRRRVQANYRSGVVNPSVDIKTGRRTYFRDKPIRHPAYRVGDVRRKGSASSIQACSWNCGNSERDAKRRGQVKKSEAASINARSEDGPTCSSDEATVMVAERRGRVVPVDVCANFLERMSI